LTWPYPQEAAGTPRTASKSARKPLGEVSANDLANVEAAAAAEEAAPKKRSRTTKRAAAAAEPAASTPARATRSRAAKA